MKQKTEAWHDVNNARLAAEEIREQLKKAKIDFGAAEDKVNMLKAKLADSDAKFQKLCRI